MEKFNEQDLIFINLALTGYAKTSSGKMCKKLPETIKKALELLKVEMAKDKNGWSFYRGK